MMDQNMLLSLVIRPPKSTYPNDNNTTVKHTFAGTAYEQKNITVRNDGGMNL